MLTKPVRDDMITTGSTRLHYVQWGEQGSPVLCVHGLSANAFCFQALADELATEHRVFAYDLRGRGDSEKPEHGYSVPIHAAELHTLIQALGLERPVIVGHSLGALIALYFAAHYPASLSKLVLIDAGAPLAWKTPEEQPAWLTASISRLGMSIPSYQDYIQRLQAAPFLGPYWNAYLDLYCQHDVATQADGSVVSKCYRQGVLEEGMRTSEAASDQQWTHVQVPTLLLRAGQRLFFDNDQLLTEADAAAIQQGIRDCQYVNFPSLNHYTIVFGTESGPAQEIRRFIEQ